MEESLLLAFFSEVRGALSLEERFLFRKVGFSDGTGSESLSVSWVDAPGAVWLLVLAMRCNKIWRWDALALALARLLSSSSLLLAPCYVLSWLQEFIGQRSKGHAQRRWLTNCSVAMDVARSGGGHKYLTLEISDVIDVIGTLKCQGSSRSWHSRCQSLTFLT